MKPVSAFLCLVLNLIAMSSMAQNDSMNSEKEVDDYQYKLEQQFEQESAWYRTWNRFEVNPGFSKYAIGPALSQPILGWDEYDEIFGLKYRSGHLEAGGLWWKGVSDGDTTASHSNRFHAGYFTPINKFKLGRRYMDVKGFLVQPVLGLGVCRTQKSFGGYISPGIHFQLPFVVASARLNTEYTFGQGFNFFPEISLQLDALRTLLDPNLVKTGTNTHKTTTAQPLGGGYYLVKTTVSTNGVYVKDIGPFWGITPRYGFFNPAWAGNKDLTVNSYGVALTGRINFLGADIRVDRSQMIPGVTPNVNALDPTISKHFDNTQVAGRINSTEITFEGTINLVGLVLQVIKPSNYQHMGMKTTPLNRFNFHLGLTRFVPGKASYLNPTQAKMYTDSFFSANPDIERNAINDPLIHEGGWGVSYGISYEMGVVGFGWTNKLSKTYGRTSFVEVYYIVPIVKVLKAYR